MEDALDIELGRLMQLSGVCFMTLLISTSNKNNISSNNEISKLNTYFIIYITCASRTDTVLV